MTTAVGRVARLTIFCQYVLHTLRWDRVGWNGLCCAMRCDAKLCLFMHMNIHTYKMADDDDEDDALMLSATYCELMHIHLYWSLIGSSLLAGKKTREAFLPAPRSTAQLVYVNASVEILRVTSTAHPTPSQRSVCKFLLMPCSYRVASELNCIQSSWVQFGSDEGYCILLHCRPMILCYHSVVK